MEEICNSLKTKHIRRIYEKSKALFPCVFVVLKALVKNRENQAKRLWKHSRTIRVSPAFSFSNHSCLYNIMEIQRTPATISHSAKIPVISKIDFPFRDLICDNCSMLHLTVRNGIYSIMKRNKNRTPLVAILFLFIARLRPKLHISYHI